MNPAMAQVRMVAAAAVCPAQLWPGVPPVTSSPLSLPSGRQGPGLRSVRRPVLQGGRPGDAPADAHRYVVLPVPLPLPVPFPPSFRQRFDNFLPNGELNPLRFPLPGFLS